MKQKLDCTTDTNEYEVCGHRSSFLGILPIVLPLADHLVRQLIDYKAFDIQLAFSNLELN